MEGQIGSVAKANFALKLTPKERQIRLYQLQQGLLQYATHKVAFDDLYAESSAAALGASVEDLNLVEQLTGSTTLRDCFRSKT